MIYLETLMPFGSKRDETISKGFELSELTASFFSETVRQFAISDLDQVNRPDLPLQHLQHPDKLPPFSISHHPLEQVYWVQVHHHLMTPKNRQSAY